MVNWTLLRVCLFLLILDWSWEYEIDSGFCGEPKAKPGITGKIIGGESSSNGEWPWQVLILRNGKLHGGGVLIERQWILTAAHCIITRRKKYGTQDLSFFVGTNRRQGSDENSKEVTASDFICHDDYDKYTFENDLCLVYLTKPLEFTDFILPICLPSFESTVEVGAEAIATGWGITEGGHAADVLQKVVLRVTDRQDCSNEYYDKLKSRIPEKHFCAGDAEKDSCSGDSGGPLVVEETSSSGRVAFVLRGITSFGPEEGCAFENLPGTFVRVSEYLSWIYQEIYRCGEQRVNGVLGRAYGGEPSYSGEWPWQVLILKDGTLHCGGVLIKRQWILTAANCIMTKETYKQSLSFIVGTKYVNGSGKNAKHVTASDFICHEDFDSSTFANDLCLVYLTKRLEFTEYIAPICLPLNESKMVEVGAKTIATGWGETEDKRFARIFQKVELRVEDTKSCRTKYYKEYRHQLPERHFCAGDAGKDTCFGDSGGPLVVKVTSSRGRDSFVLMGITSIGPKDCATENMSGAFVRVSQYMSWIYQKTSQMNFIKTTAMTSRPYETRNNVTVTEPPPREQKPAIWSISNKTRTICGKPHISRAASNKVTNGEMSKVENMPWQVLIKENNGMLDDSNQPVSCGGSLVDEAWIVTTAHCLRRPLEEYSIFIGGHDYTNSSRKKALEVQAGAFICHPDYNRTTFEHDVCLIKLAKPVRYSRHIIPVCLPIEGERLTAGKAAIGTGWGKPKGVGEKSRLRKAHLSIVDAENCSALFQSGIPKSLLCTRHGEGSDPCEWESGGPLVRKEVTSHNEAYVLRGVAGLSSSCSAEKSTHAYTRISNHLKWINKTISEMSLKTCEAVHSRRCGGNITKSTIFRSPTKKEQFTYPRNTLCRWKIEAPSGYRLSFKFLCYFLLSSGDNDCGDRLSITTGTGIKTLCGNELPETIFVDSNHSTVEFSTDDEMEYQGFVVEVKFLPPGILGRNFVPAGGRLLPTTNEPTTTSSGGRLALMNYATAIAVAANVMTFTLWY